ncbi:MAG: hypothetical protein OXG98_11160 [Gemmatimonadetes bacterium]|nr:hypothetical protein [Gemmatimonadota bacterium]
MGFARDYPPLARHHAPAATDNHLDIGSPAAIPFPSPVVLDDRLA